MILDDLSGMLLSGNKTRKLQVLTLGGIQSSHYHASSVAAMYLNLECYLILRSTYHQADLVVL